MDNALRLRMETFPTKAQVAGLINPTQSEPSTLIKADIALFHDAPDISAALNHADGPKLSEYETGLQDGEVKANLVYQDTIRLMETTLAAMKAELAAMAEQIEQNHMAAVSTCLQAIFPALMQTGTLKEIQTLLQSLSSAAVDGNIALISHSDNSANLERLCQAQDQDIKLITNDALDINIVQVKWQGGGAIIDNDAVRRACLGVLEKTQSSLSLPPLSSHLQEQD